MKVMIKICGLTTKRAVDAFVDAGADIAGFVFAESPRRVTPVQAVELADGLAEDIPRVAVMQHPLPEEVDEVLNIFRPTFLQTDLHDFTAFQLFDTTRPLPVLRSGRTLPTKMPRLLLFEGPVSGSGALSDWDAAASLARQTKIVLAGGLTPKNVGDAIRKVRPYGVDVSSGVETEPGVKDPALIEQFVAAVRKAEAATKLPGEVQ